MELLSIPAHSTSSSSTKVLVLDGTTAKSRTAEQIRIDGGGASTSHAATHASNGTDPVEVSQAQVFDTLQLEDGSFLLAENGKKLSIQGVDDIRDLINAVKTVSASDAILGRKSPGSGFFEELTISDVLDFIGATARGDIVYRGADGWDRLPAGTSGQFLRTQGTTGDPTWATVTGSVSDGDKGDITVSNSGNTWTIDNQAVSYAKIQNISATSRILGRKSGSSGSTEECTLSEVLDMVGGAAHGDILYRGASGWARLAAGTSGNFLRTNGSGQNPSWVAGGSASKQADLSVLPFPGVSDNEVRNTDHNDGFPASTNSPIFRTEFVPTNFTVSLFCENGTVAAAASGQCGVKLQYSTSSNNTGWQDVPNSTVNVLNKSGEFLFTTSSVSIPNSPSAVYWRLAWVSTLLDSAPTPNVVYGVFVGHSVMIRLWN